MIKTERLNGFEYQYLVVKSSRLDVSFNIGCTVKQLGSGYEAAINFPFANTETGVPIGMVIVDGQTVISDIEKTKSRDMFYMTKSGVAHIGPCPKELPEWGVKGSPRLLNGGVKVLKQSIIRDNTPNDITLRPAQRTAVGIREDGDVVLLATNTIMDLDDLTDIMVKLGCIDALNGDGGGSSYLWPEDTGWGRKVGAAIVVKKETQPVTKTKLIIDAGHGGKDGGGGSNEKWLEKNMTLQISLYQKNRFDQLGHGDQVALTRKTDIYIAPEDRTKLVRDSGAEYCISNHINAGGGDGAEFIHSIHGDGAFEKLLSKEVNEEGQQTRRIFKRAFDSDPKKDYYFMHRETGSVKTTIIEYGFADSKADDVEQLLNHWKDYAEAVVEAFCKQVGWKYVAPNITTTTTTQPPVKMPTKDQVPVIQKKLKVSVNGRPEVDGYLIDDVTYVPVRFVSEALGAKVDWNGGTPIKITK